jgi:hypothetical protein
MLFAFLVLGLGGGYHRDKAANVGALNVFRERIKSDRHGRRSVRNLGAPHISNLAPNFMNKSYNPPIDDSYRARKHGVEEGRGTIPL